ncbi:hypothetical protein Tco_0926294 [Tanacetum coccineum]|uniref:Uncharacterized protein n=1 Tax=Tanacetum coccineum TaxID=301880 RepID=A0ABQ5DAI9_9ASTR
MSDTESDDTIQIKVSKKKATKKALVKKIDKKQADNKNKQKSTESESDSDFAVGTFVKYNEVEIKKKGKRPTVQKDSDCEDAVCTKKKRKGNKREDNMIVNCEPEEDAKVEVKAKTNDKKAINSRMSTTRNFVKGFLYSTKLLYKEASNRKWDLESVEGKIDCSIMCQNVEQKEKKVPDDMVWDKTNAIVPFDDYHDKEYNDNVSVHNQDYDYDVMVEESLLK